MKLIVTVKQVLSKCKHSTTTNNPSLKYTPCKQYMAFLK